MLKKEMAILLVFFILISVSCSKQNIEDINAIRQAALDYGEGYYTGDAERMARALHPNFVKRIVKSPESNSIMQELSKDMMVNMTKNGGGKNSPNKKIKITILDINNNVASVKIEGEYIEYLHLAKFNNTWVLINDLWNFNENIK